MGESNNGFVFIDNPKQLIEVAEKQFKPQNITGSIVKILISNVESVPNFNSGYGTLEVVIISTGFVGEAQLNNNNNVQMAIPKNLE